MKKLLKIREARASAKSKVKTAARHIELSENRTTLHVQDLLERPPKENTKKANFVEIKVKTQKISSRTNRTSDNFVALKQEV